MLDLEWLLEVYAKLGFVLIIYKWRKKSMFNIFFYIKIWLVCLFVCRFVCIVSNKRQNGWIDRVHIFCGTSRDPREGLWMIKISNICLHQNSIFIKFLKILKIHEIFLWNPRIIFVLFHDVHKENIFTINLGDGHEAPSKTQKHTKQSVPGENN